MYRKQIVQDAAKVLGVATLTLGLAACSGGNNASKQAAETPAAESAAKPQTAAAAVLSSDDKDFLTAVAKGGYGEIQLAQLALEKSRSKDVHAFAQKLIEDHQKLGGDLAKIASTKGVTLPDSASLASAFKEGTLKAFSGTHFDQSFLKKMVSDHEDTITAFQKEAASGSDTDVKDFASTNLQTLKEHLSAAQELENKTNVHRGAKS